VYYFLTVIQIWNNKFSANVFPVTVKQSPCNNPASINISLQQEHHQLRADLPLGIYHLVSNQQVMVFYH
jgi:hypothetical protein